MEGLNLKLDAQDLDEFIANFNTNPNGKIDYRDFKALLTDCRGVSQKKISTVKATVSRLGPAL